MAEVYYVREPDAEEALGPFPIEHLQSWGEIGRISPDTLYYDDELEAWAKIGANEALHRKVFPPRKKLSLKASSASVETTREAEVEEDEPEENVEAMLAAAEGDTEDTKHIREQELWRERTASILCPVLALILLVSAVTYIFPNWDVVGMFLRGSPEATAAALNRPLLLVAGLDLILAAATALSATSIFPFLRFRAMIGAGFFGMLYFANHLTGDPTGLGMAAAVIATSLGIYVMTLTLDFRLMVASATVGLLGVVGLAWITTVAPLLATS